MAHDDEELDWGEDDGWATEPVVATMDVDRPDLIHTNGDGSATQQTLNKDDMPHVSEKVAVSPEQKADLSSAQSGTRNGGHERRDSRRTPSRSSSDFGKSLPSSLPQRPTTIAPHVEESDPLAASAMARSPSKSTNGLPPEWEERKSRTSGATYYFNLKTEETTWTKPIPATGTATTSGPPRPDSPSTSRRERERRGPTSPSVPSTLPPPPFSLPARPQTFNSSQQRRDRSVSPPPPRARSRERQKEPLRDSRGVRGDRPPPRTRDVQMRDPSPEPTRRYRSPSPQAARERGKTGASRVYNDRDRSPPPRAQRPSSPPARRDDRGPRRPEDRYPPRTRSRSPAPSRRRSPSPPATRRARTPPPPRGGRRPSPPPSSSLPQKRRGDTPPPPSARSTVYSDRYDGQRDHDGQEESQVKRRRVEDDNVNDTQNDRRDGRFGPRVVEDGRRAADDPIPSKRTPLPPQDQRFRTAVSKPPRHRSPRRRSSSPTSLPPTAPETRSPSLSTPNSNGRDSYRNERPQEGRPIRKREGEKIKLPETSAAVAAAYSNRRRTVSSKDEVPSPINSEVPSSRDGPASKLPPSGPGGRAPRSYGPALRDGPPRPRSPEALIGKEPPRGPRGSHRSPNVSLRPLSPRREPSPPRERSPPRRERSPPRRPRSPPASQQPYSSHRPNGRDGPSVDYDMSTRPYDSRTGRRAEVDRVGATHTSRAQALEQQPAGPPPGRDRARGRNPNQPHTGAMRVWGQPQNKRSPESEVLGRYDDGAERNALNDGGPYQSSRNEKERELNEHSQDGSRPGYAHQSYPPSRRSTVDGTPLVEEDARLPVPDERSRASSAYSGDHMDLDEERTWPDSAQYTRDDGQSTRSGRSLEDEFGQRPDPLPEARRLSIQERDGTSQYNRRDDFDAGSRPIREMNGRSGNWPVRDDPPSPQPLRARSSSPSSSSHRNVRPQPSSRMPVDVSAGQKDAMVSSSRSEDFGAIQQTQPGWPSSHEQIGNEDRSNGDDKGRKDTTTGRLRIVRRDLSPTSTNGPGSSLEPLSAQPTLISVDTTKDSAGREGPSVEGQGLSRKGSLLARLSVPGASSSGDRSKGKRDQLAPSPTGGSSASLQARLENGERPALSRRDTDDGDRRKRKPRRGRPGPGGGRNRDAQG